MIASNVYLLVQEKNNNFEIELRNTTAGIETNKKKKKNTTKKHTHESLNYVCLQFLIVKFSCATLLALQSWHGFLVEANMDYIKRFHSSHALDE